MPVTLELSEASQAPVLLANSDVQASAIDNLRDTEAGQTRLGVSLRKRTQSANPWLGFLIDGLDARASYATADGSTITTENKSSTVDAGVGWTRTPEARDVGLVPAPARGLVRALLPGFLEDKVADARLRLTPERVSLGSSLLSAGQPRVALRAHRTLLPRMRMAIANAEAEGTAPACG